MFDKMESVQYSGEERGRDEVSAYLAMGGIGCTGSWPRSSYIALWRDGSWAVRLQLALG